MSINLSPLAFIRRFIIYPYHSPTLISEFSSNYNQLAKCMRIVVDLGLCSFSVADYNDFHALSITFGFHLAEIHGYVVWYDILPTLDGFGGALAPRYCSAIRFVRLPTPTSPGGSLLQEYRKLFHFFHILIYPFNWVCRYEELYLTSFFGDEYRLYRRRVGILIPFIDSSSPSPCPSPTSSHNTIKAE